MSLIRYTLYFFAISYIKFVLDYAGGIIVNDLIPAVTKLWNKYDIQFSTMFSSDFLSTHRQPSRIWSSDI